MTLIVGLNLSDRLYLGADTRVTYPDNTFEDNIIKVAHLIGVPVPIIGEENFDTIFLAVAGNLNYATYLYKEIKNDIDNGKLSSDIRVLFNNIDDYIKEKTDVWLKSNPYKNCCIIFAGTNNSRKKEVNITKLNELQKVYKKNIKSPTELQKAKKQLENDSFFKELLKKIPSKKLMRPFDEPYAMEINPIIKKAIEDNDETINVPDGLIFSIAITKEGVSKQKAEWGEFLAYGSGGLTKKNLPEEFLAHMELSPGQLVTQQDMMETLYIKDQIIKIAEDNNIKKIGGTVTPIVIRKNVYKTIFEYRQSTLEGKIIEEVYVSNGNIYFRRNSYTPIKLLNFFEYNSSKGDAQL